MFLQIHLELRLALLQLLLRLLSLGLLVQESLEFLVVWLDCLHQVMLDLSSSPIQSMCVGWLRILKSRPTSFRPPLQVFNLWQMTKMIPTWMQLQKC